MPRTHPPEKHIIPLTVLVLISTILFLNTFRNSFMWDDDDWIGKNRYVKSLKHIPYVFTPRYWKYHDPAKGVYRPVWTVTFALDYFIWKLNPVGYHLTNLLLHIMNVILIYFLIYRLLGRSKEEEISGGMNLKGFKFMSLPFLSALFFAAHPIHVESVTWIKNRSDLLALLFFLLSFLFFIRSALQEEKGIKFYFYPLSLFCFVLSLFSKTMGISLPLILLLYMICFSRTREYGRMVKRILPFWGIAALFLLFKRIVFGTLALSDNNSLALGFYSHILAVLKTIGYYLWLLIFPVNLQADRIFITPRSCFEPAVFSSVAVLLFLAAVMIRTFKYSRNLSFAIGWILLTLLPVSNIIFLSSRPIAEQRLYIPSAGFCLLVGMGLRQLASLEIAGYRRVRLKNSAALFSIFICIFYSVITMRRNLDWRNSYTFWLKTVQQSPNNANVQYNLANTFRKMGKINEAIASYQRAIMLSPEHINAHYNLGVAYIAVGKIDAAIGLYKKVIERSPDYTDVYNNLGVAYKLMGKRDEAMQLWKTAIERNPHDVEAYNNLGVTYAAVGKNDAAVSLYKKAIESDPGYIETYNNLGLVYNALGGKVEAEAMFKQAITINSNYAKAYYNLGDLYDGLGRTDMAIISYKKAIESDPEYSDAYNSLGVALNALGRKAEAEAMFKQAIELNPGHGRGYNNLSLFYFYEKRYRLAIEYCDKAEEAGYINPDLIDVLRPYREQGD